MQKATQMQVETCRAKEKKETTLGCQTGVYLGQTRRGQALHHQSKHDYQMETAQYQLTGRENWQFYIQTLINLSIKGMICQC